MTKRSVSFLVPSEKVGQIDALATIKDRDRSFVLNEAVDLYLDLHQHHVASIERGIADFEAGHTFSHAEVGRALDAQRKKRKKLA